MERIDHIMFVVLMIYTELLKNLSNLKLRKSVRYDGFSEISGPSYDVVIPILVPLLENP